MLCFKAFGKPELSKCLVLKHLGSRRVPTSNPNPHEKQPSHGRHSGGACNLATVSGAKGGGLQGGGGKQISDQWPVTGDQ